MATKDNDAALDRVELALTRLEAVVSARLADAAASIAAAAELAELQTRHDALKDSVAQELHQLDLLLSGLPQ